MRTALAHTCLWVSAEDEQKETRWGCERFCLQVIATGAAVHAVL